jgi:DNA repair protein RadA
MQIKVNDKQGDTAQSHNINLEIQDVEGIGPTTERKLRDAGVTSVMDLAVCNIDQLAVDINSSKDSAAAFIMAAQKLLRESNVLEKEFVTADFVLEKRKAMLRCSTGSKSLDELLLGGIESQAVTEFYGEFGSELLLGGIESQAVTEFYGEFGSGKSQICHTLCAMAKQPINEGGLDGGVIYIDTEGTFRPERLNQIADSKGFVPLEVLKNTTLCKVYNSSHLELIVKDLGRYIHEFNAKLVIVDSIVSLHRAEFTGRGTLAERQQRLNSILQKLVRIAEIFNVAIVITNQVLSSPDTFFGDPTKAAGGNVIGHTSTYRIYLRKSGENRIAKMIDSPHHPYSDIRFTVNEKGVDDLEDDLNREKLEGGSD